MTLRFSNSVHISTFLYILYRSCSVATPEHSETLTSIELVIPKFRGTKRISTLPAFPLKYHPDENQVKSDLVKCGRKFVSLMGTYYCYCQGKAFFMHRGDPVRVSVNSRMMIDADFFWKINPNYSRPRADIATPNSGSSPSPGYWPWKPS